MRNRLYRDEQNKKIGGVCAGLAEYFNVDVSLVRVLFVLAVVLGGGGVLGYVILWIVVPPMPVISPADEFFASAGPQPQPAPFAPVNRQVTTGGIVGGIILIMLGVYLTLDQYDIIPNFDFNTFWPIALIVVGLILMFGFWQKKPVDSPAPWDNNTSGNDTSSLANDTTSSTDNSQTI